MINKMYAIKDNLSGAFFPTVPFKNDELAKRWFGGQVRYDRSLAYSPKDYDLYYVGTWDDESGTLLSEQGTPKLIEKAVNYTNG